MTDQRVNELVTTVGQPQNLVSYHLAVLKRAGLVTERRSSADARDIYYHLDLERVGGDLRRSALQLHPALALDQPHREESRLGRRPARVLFICSGNSARSQIAEALLRSIAGRSVEVRSAGPRPAGINPLTVTVLTELGLPTHGLRSKGLDEVAQSKFDCVVTLCDIAREECPPRLQEPTTIHWSLADPAAHTGSPAARLNAFRETAAEIEVRIRQLIPVLIGGGNADE